MRGRENVALAVRRPDGILDVTSQPLANLYKGRLREIPLIRGMIILIETLVLGIKALLHSAQIASTEEEEELSPALMWGSVAISVAFAVVLFFIFPLLITRYIIDPYITSSIVSNLVEGILRIGIFIAYLKLISLMSDIKTVFAYHGAEHKVINAYEAGEPLEVESVKKYSTAHTRCGTSFLIAVLVISIIVFALLGRPPILLSILSRIVLIPVIAAIGYEFVRFSSAHAQNFIVRGLLTPGLMLQSMTTREPDDGQLETAISSLKEVMEADNWEQPVFNEA